MMNPSGQDDLPYVRIAIYATRRLRIWTWPAWAWRRVLLAAMLADGSLDAALAAIEEAARVVSETNPERQR